MKIIDKGNPNWKPWWAGLIIECNECNQKFELEEGDEMKPCFDFGRTSILLYCPRCYTQITKHRNIPCTPCKAISCEQPPIKAKAIP